MRIPVQLFATHNHSVKTWDCFAVKQHKTEWFRFRANPVDFTEFFWSFNNCPHDIHFPRFFMKEE